MLARGSLAETDLRTLLEAAQAERATGTLTLRIDGRQPTTLYFLFGHLFHAVGDGVAGDEAVIAALRWSEGEFDFDAKAKLPADESVRSSIAELLERAGVTPRPSAATPSTEPAGWTGAPEGSVQPPSPPEPAAAGAPLGPAPPAASPQTPPPPAPPPDLRRGLKFRPMPRHGREPIPVPHGDLMYDSLKTSFVDFPRLLHTLEREGYTGYVRLLTDNASGLIYFREGTALECVFDAGQDEIELGRTALQHFAQEVARGQGVLDVVGLSTELVDGLYHVTVAQPIYTQLYADWVDMSAFLKFLEERLLTGSLMVRAKEGTGVIILDNGKLAGAYTSESREVARTAEAVLALCQDPTAMIEVKAAAEVSHEPLDLSDVLGTRVAAAPPPPPARAPEPPPPAAAPPPQPTPVMAAAASPPTLAGYTAPPPQTAEAIDLEQVVADLMQMTDEALGNRSRKVKDVLAAAERTPAGLEAAIAQIPQISILFVDASRLESLANELRAKLHSHLG